MTEQRALADPCGACDLIHRHVLGALLGDEPFRRGQDRIHVETVVPVKLADRARLPEVLDA